MKLKINYWAPTPKRMRRIGDALLAAAIGLQAVNAGLLTNDKWITVSAVCLALGKFLTNFFADDTQTPTP